jgi:Flp pilus assembly pilin Flp
MSLWSKQTSPHSACCKRSIADFLQKIWPGEEGQDIAEYAIMLAVILGLAIGTVRAVGASANTVFFAVGSTIQ